MIVRQISATETIPVRHAVLRKNKPINTCHFSGDHLPNTFHLGVFLDTELVGICTLVEDEKVILHKTFSYQLRGMAVLENYQGKNIGKTLMEFLPDFLKEKNIPNIWCNARKNAVSFYQKFGFEMHGDAFEIEEVGTHILMFNTYE